MPINTGYLTSDRTVAGDEIYTPFYAVQPLLKYIKKTDKIWMPFDEKWSAFNQLFSENGYNVEISSLASNKNFFEYEPKEYDIIISNPPFSKKDQIIKRLYDLGKPFAILLPLNSLQGAVRYEYFKQGIQILSFDTRIHYHTDNWEKTTIGTPFASAYFCRNVLPKDLIIEKLNKYGRTLKEGSP